MAKRDHTKNGWVKIEMNERTDMRFDYSKQKYDENNNNNNNNNTSDKNCTFSFGSCILKLNTNAVTLS